MEESGTQGRGGVWGVNSDQSSLTCSQCYTERASLGLVKASHSCLFCPFLFNLFPLLLTMCCQKTSSRDLFLSLWFNLGSSSSLKLLKLPSFDAPQSLAPGLARLKSFLRFHILLSGSFVTNRRFWFRIWRLKIKSRQKCCVHSVSSLIKVNKLQGM